MTVAEVIGRVRTALWLRTRLYPVACTLCGLTTHKTLSQRLFTAPICPDADDERCFQRWRVRHGYTDGLQRGYTSTDVSPKEAVMSDLDVVIEHDNIGMSATCRCDRCGAQAWVAVTLKSGRSLLFCRHHYEKHEDKVKESAIRIADYRPYLLTQEKGQRDAASAAT